MFIDSADILVQAGNGGGGAISFRREKHVPKGGPDGGDGGRGGDVILIANINIGTLMDFRYRREYVAENGIPGMGARKTGRNGKDIEIQLPVGTLIYDAITNQVIADFDKHAQVFVVSKGGLGGRGNSNFATSTMQTPRYAEKGKLGESRSIRLELKMLADIGLVGFPNAGKSTLISRISAAKPKIADYPFTTLIPNIGIVRVGEGQSFAVADIPGLIEGASEGKGLGHQFLRHVERSGALCFLLDGLSEDKNNDYKILLKELKKYNPDMLEKERIICITKSDSMNDDQRKEVEKIRINRKKPLIISAVSGENVNELVALMYHSIKKIWYQIGWNIIFYYY